MTWAPAISENGTGLADPVRADQAHHFAGRYVQVDPIQRQRLAIVQGDVGQAHHRRGLGAASPHIRLGGFDLRLTHWAGSLTFRLSGHGACGSSRT